METYFTYIPWHWGYGWIHLNNQNVMLAAMQYRNVTELLVPKKQKLME